MVSQQDQFQSSEEIQKQVDRGQMVRGYSPWGSSPFPTGDMGAHRRQRGRRLVFRVHLGRRPVCQSSPSLGRRLLLMSPAACS